MPGQTFDPWKMAPRCLLAPAPHDLGAGWVVVRPGPAGRRAVKRLHGRKSRRRRAAATRDEASAPR